MILQIDGRPGFSTLQNCLTAREIQVALGLLASMTLQTVRLQNFDNVIVEEGDIIVGKLSTFVRGSGRCAKGENGNGSR